MTDLDSERIRLASEGMYRPEFESDACGVGLVAATDGTPSRRVVQSAIDALKAVWHRGAVDADGKRQTARFLQPCFAVPAFRSVCFGMDDHGASAEPGDDNGGRRSSSAEPGDDSSASSADPSAASGSAGGVTTATTSASTSVATRTASTASPG